LALPLALAAPAHAVSSDWQALDDAKITSRTTADLNGNGSRIRNLDLDLAVTTGDELVITVAGLADDEQVRAFFEVILADNRTDTEEVVITANGPAALTVPADGRIDLIRFELLEPTPADDDDRVALSNLQFDDVDGPADQTLYFKPVTVITGRLDATSPRFRVDRLQVSTSPVVAGAEVRFYRVRNNGSRVFLAERTTGPGGNAVLRVDDGSPRSSTNYVARVLPTDDTTGDRTNFDRAE
jgi:hypothetical protein